MDLKTSVLATIAAYIDGAFPMAENGEIEYFKCNPRSVYFPDSFHIPRSLKKLYRKRPFELRIDTAFEEIVLGCRAGRPEWISGELVQVYLELFHLGMAHSVEAWLGGELAGGLYGTHFGAAFLAESMFHRVDNASNICLVFLMERLKERGFHFCDIQYPNSHTMRFHPVMLSIEKFEELFHRALEAEAEFT